jgi:hypothetical protein
MLSFKQFLIEMPTLMKSFDEKENRLVSTNDIPNGNKVGALSSGHDLYHEEKPLTHVWTAFNPSTNRHDMRLHTVALDDGRHVVQNVEGRKDSSIKAHELYHHLVSNGHLKELISDYTQSPGGSKVWRRLSTMNGVSVNHLVNNKEEPLQKNWDDHFKPDYRKSHFVLRKS